MAGRPLRHPPIEGIGLAAVLQALSDPVRLAIVHALTAAESESGLSCVETVGRAAIALPKSTCSQHFRILREAGLIRCERRGVELTSRLRRAELEARFPGLLAAVLGAYREEGARRAGRPD